jgi:DNA repair protein RadC
MKKLATIPAYGTLPANVSIINKSAKRVPVVTIKLIREASVLYPTRRINSPLDAYDILKSFLVDADRENFYAIYLNTKNEPAAIHPVSIGSLNASLVHPREVYKAAIPVNASSVILSHNHPSGDPTPSREDLEVSKRLKEAGTIIGIEVLDHIIFGSETNYYSLKEHGNL